MGRATSQQGTLISDLVGMSVIQLQMDSIRLSLAQGLLTRDCMARARQSLRGQVSLVPDPAEVLRLEAIFGASMLAPLYLRVGDDGVPRISAINSVAISTCSVSLFVENEPPKSWWKSWSEDFVCLDTWDACGPLFSRWNKTEADLKKFSESVGQWADQSPFERRPFERVLTAFEESLEPRDHFSRQFAAIVSDSYRTYVSNRDHHALDLLGLDVILALEIWRLDHGAYPESLHALIPGMLASIPRDPFSGDSLRYRATTAEEQKARGFEYVLYSVGVDGKDDGGSAPRDNAWWEALSTHEILSGGTDYILSRPARR